VQEVEALDDLTAPRFEHPLKNDFKINHIVKVWLFSFKEKDYGEIYP
jgi:hypothetical protein